MGRLRHQDGEGQGLGKVRLVLCSVTSSPSASVSSFSYFCPKLCVGVSLSVFCSLCVLLSLSYVSLHFSFSPSLCLISLHISLSLCMSLCISLARSHLPSPIPLLCLPLALSPSLWARRDGVGSSEAGAAWAWCPLRQDRPGFVAAPPLSAAAAAPYLLASGHETRIRATRGQGREMAGQAGG